MSKCHQIVGYADDVAIIARREKELKEVTSVLVNEKHKMGVQLNQKE